MSSSQERISFKVKAYFGNQRLFVHIVSVKKNDSVQSSLHWPHDNETTSRILEVGRV